VNSNNTLQATPTSNLSGHATNGIKENILSDPEKLLRLVPYYEHFMNIELFKLAEDRDVYQLGFKEGHGRAQTLEKHKSEDSVLFRKSNEIIEKNYEIASAFCAIRDYPVLPLKTSVNMCYPYEWEPVKHV
jgi:hypothetical protein